MSAMSDRTKCEEARYQSLRSAIWGATNAGKTLDRIHSRLETSPLQEWLDRNLSLEDSVCTSVDWNNVPYWSVTLADKASDLPRKLVADGLVHKMEKVQAWDGESLKLTGLTDWGESITFYGYLTPGCTVESYVETVTKHRVVCGDAAEAEGTDNG
jgi:hypothetical protein